MRYRGGRECQLMLSQAPVESSWGYHPPESTHWCTATPIRPPAHPQHSAGQSRQGLQPCHKGTTQRLTARAFMVRYNTRQCTSASVPAGSSKGCSHIVRAARVQVPHQQTLHPLVRIHASRRAPRFRPRNKSGTCITQPRADRRKGPPIPATTHSHREPMNAHGAGMSVRR
jgi:hypothetical protein